MLYAQSCFYELSFEDLRLAFPHSKIPANSPNQQFRTSQMLVFWV